LYLRLGTRKCRSRTVTEYASSGQRRLTSRGVAAIVAFAALGALGFALLAFLASREQNPSLIIAIEALRPQLLRIRWRRFARGRANKVISSNSTFRSQQTARCLWCTTVT
jgi:hypothetical protein